MFNRRSVSSWLPAVGLWGPRQRFAAGLLADSYLIMRRAGVQPPPYAEPSPASLLLETHSLHAGEVTERPGVLTPPASVPFLEVAHV